MRAGLARLGAEASIAAVVGSAAGHLYLYRLWRLLRGRSPALAVRLVAHWSRRTCAWFRLEVRTHGTPPATRCLYVANHRSYLDIPVLASALAAAFMSRADVATWPVIGPAAKAIDAVFVDRDDPRARVRAARALTRRLCGGSVVVFPEGTTNGEILPRPFQPGLFRLLHRLGIPVVPVTIRYSRRTAYWTDDTPLHRHLAEHVLGGPRLQAAVHIATPLGGRDYADGQSLAQAAYRAVCAPIEELGELA